MDDRGKKLTRWRAFTCSFLTEIPALADRLPLGGLADCPGFEKAPHTL